MAIRSLTYTDIPLAKRQETASKALDRLRERLNDPSTNPEQLPLLTQQLAKLEQWASDPLPEEGT
jgi:hypothetical protein